jgi:hypothetical protein
MMVEGETSIRSNPSLLGRFPVFRLPRPNLSVFICVHLWLIPLPQLHALEQPPMAIASPPKAPVAFNRLYDYPELSAILKKLVAAHPELLSLRSLGQSTEGRDLWCVTINNPKTGDDRSKPAMYVDGNIHGNEIQGAEAALYVIWYLAASPRSTRTAGPTGSTRRTPPTARGAARARWTTTATAGPTRTATTTSTATARSRR